MLTISRNLSGRRTVANYIIKLHIRVFLLVCRLTGHTSTTRSNRSSSSSSGSDSHGTSGCTVCSNVLTLQMSSVFTFQSSTDSYSSGGNSFALSTHRPAVTQCHADMHCVCVMLLRQCTGFHSSAGLLKLRISRSIQVTCQSSTRCILSTAAQLRCCAC